jgi:hypothetical protein
MKDPGLAAQIRNELQSSNGTALVGLVAWQVMERATGAAMNHRAIGISTRYGYSQQSKAAFCPTPKTKYRDSLEYTSNSCPVLPNPIGV